MFQKFIENLKPVKEKDSFLFESISHMRKNPYDLVLGRNKFGLHPLKTIVKSSCLFTGSMGSGYIFSAYTAFLLRNLAHPNDLMIWVSIGKTSRPIHFRKNFIHLENKEDLIKSAIDFCLVEMNSRKKIFANDYENICDFNKKNTNSKLNCVFLIFQESVIDENPLDYLRDEVSYKVYSKKLNLLIKEGKKFGIHINFIASSISTKLNPCALNMFDQILEFACDPLDRKPIKHSHAQNIKMEEKGKAAIDNEEFVFFPYISEEISRKLFKIFNDSAFHSNLVSFNQNFLSEIKSNPNRIIYEDILFWDFIKNGNQKIE